jgi:Xaa-Pro aminopeptidase
MPQDPAALRSRLAAARALVVEHSLDALVVSPGPDLSYFVGFPGDSMERLLVLVIPRERGPFVILPIVDSADYAPLLAEIGVEVAAWTDGSDAYARLADLLGPVSRVALSDQTAQVHAVPLLAALGVAAPAVAPGLVSTLRMRKSPGEIASLRAGSALIDRVGAAMPSLLQPGRTEREVHLAIRERVLAEGAATADYAIVQSGPNGALMHSEYSERRIEPGDLVVVDVGGMMPDGYFFDTTRTYAAGPVSDPEALRAFDVLFQAQRAQLDAARPGITAEALDAVGRDLIAAAGFGEFFTHRTGHGIGLEMHEAPFVVEGSDLLLHEGFAFTIEPGIYVPGRFGMRIEDVVVLTADGVEILNRRPRSLVDVTA